MEALSRREEEEVEAKAKAEALKACDDVVKGEFGGERRCGLRRRTWLGQGNGGDEGKERRRRG